MFLKKRDNILINQLKHNGGATPPIFKPPKKQNYDNSSKNN